MAYGFNPIRFFPSYSKNATQYSYKKRAPQGWGPAPAWFAKEQARYGFSATGRGRGAAAGRSRPPKKRSTSFKRKGKGKKVMRKKKKTSFKKKVQAVINSAEPYREVFLTASGNITYTEGIGATGTTNAALKSFACGSNATATAITPWGTSGSGDLYNMYKNCIASSLTPSLITEAQNHFYEVDHTWLKIIFKNNKSFTANAWMIDCQPRFDNYATQENATPQSDPTIAWASIASLGQAGANGSVAAGKFPPWVSPRKNMIFTRIFKINSLKKITLLPGESYTHFIRSPKLNVKNPFSTTNLSYVDLKKFERCLLTMVWGEITHDVGVPTAVQWGSAVLDYIVEGCIKARINTYRADKDNIVVYDQTVNPTALNVVAQDEMNYNAPILTGMT